MPPKRKTTTTKSTQSTSKRRPRNLLEFSNATSASFSDDFQTVLAKLEASTKRLQSSKRKASDEVDSEEDEMENPTPPKKRKTSEEEQKEDNKPPTLDPEQLRDMGPPPPLRPSWLPDSGPIRITFADLGGLGFPESTVEWVRNQSTPSTLEEVRFFFGLEGKIVAAAFNYIRYFKPSCLLPGLRRHDGEQVDAVLILAEHLDTAEETSEVYRAKPLLNHAAVIRLGQLDDRINAPRPNPAEDSQRPFIDKMLKPSKPLMVSLKGKGQSSTPVWKQSQVDPGPSSTKFPFINTFAEGIPSSPPSPKTEVSSDNTASTSANPPMLDAKQHDRQMHWYIEVPGSGSSNIIETDELTPPSPLETPETKTIAPTPSAAKRKTRGKGKGKGKSSRTAASTTRVENEYPCLAQVPPDQITSNPVASASSGFTFINSSAEPNPTSSVYPPAQAVTSFLLRPSSSVDDPEPGPGPIKLPNPPMLDINQVHYDHHQTHVEVPLPVPFNDGNDVLSSGIAPLTWPNLYENEVHNGHLPTHLEMGFPLPFDVGYDVFPGTAQVDFAHHNYDQTHFNMSHPVPFNDDNDALLSGTGSLTSTFGTGLSLPVLPRLDTQQLVFNPSTSATPSPSESSSISYGSVSPTPPPKTPTDTASPLEIASAVKEPEVQLNQFDIDNYISWDGLVDNGP